MQFKLVAKRDLPVEGAAMDDELSGRRIGITGARGFVGRCVVGEVARRGGHPIALLRTPGTVAGASEARIVGGIDGRTDWLQHLVGLDAVVHLAARVHIIDEHAAGQLAAFRRVNRDGTRRLAEACATAGVGRLVFVSSIKVNGEATAFDAARGTGAPFTETDAPDPQDAYAVSKLEAEQELVGVADATGLETVIVRPPLVHGPGAGGNLARLMRLVRRGVPLPFGAVDNRRSLVGVRNLADLLALACRHADAAGKVFLAADEEDLSTPGLVRVLAAAMGVRARLVSVPVPLVRLAGRLGGRSAEIDRLVGSLQVDAAAARRVLGWAPPVAARDGLAEMAVAFQAP
jgi:nucleoside-diphosphate-sugar epimerase